MVPEALATPYTPKHLAEKVLTSRAVLEGERKWRTVLALHLCSVSWRGSKST